MINIVVLEIVNYYNHWCQKFKKVKCSFGILYNFLTKTFIVSIIFIL